jgi:hypothetical protein
MATPRTAPLASPDPQELPAWSGLLSRRDLLRVGSVAAASTLLPHELNAGGRGGVGKPRSAGKARSVILLWMAGGVTHIDSFDPKPEAPEDVRGTLRAIDTSVAGIRFCEPLACLARAAQHLAVVRSYSHDSNDHFLSQAYALSGRRVTPAQITTEPNVGAIVSHLRGPRNGFPGYIAVPGTTRPGPPPTNLFTGGWLGSQYAPFPSGGRPRNEDFTARVPEAAEEEFNQQALRPPRDVSAARLAGRRGLQARLDAGLRLLEGGAAAAALAEHYRGAFEMLTSPAVRRAFDLGRESAKVRDWYGRTKIGQRCLLARRLVEAGARFVMVDYGSHWPVSSRRKQAINKGLTATAIFRGPRK